MEHVINLLNSPIIGKKSSFAFVSLLTGLGISLPHFDYEKTALGKTALMFAAKSSHFV